MGHRKRKQGGRRRAGDKREMCQLGSAIRKLAKRLGVSYGEAVAAAIGMLRQGKAQPTTMKGMERGEKP